MTPDQMPADNQKLLQEFLDEYKIPMLLTSTVTEDGITAVKEKACNLLLAQRVEMKMKGKQVSNIMNRLHVATPRPRDNKKRDVSIPQEVLERRSQQQPQEMEIEEKPQIVITIGGPSSRDVDPEWDPQVHDTEDLRGMLNSFY